MATYLCTGCRQKPKPAGDPSEGIPSEILVISHEDEMGAVQEAFEKGFTVTEPELVYAEKAETGIAEKMFSFHFARQQAYKSTEKQASLIIVLETDKKCGSFSDDLENLSSAESMRAGDATVDIFKNVWAKPQTVFRIKLNDAPDAAKIAAISKQLAPKMRELEIAQGLPGNLQPNAYCDSVNKLIRGTYGFGFAFPPQFRLESSNYEMIWLNQETSHFYRYVFINIFSDSSKIETQEQAIENRNYFGRKYLKNDEGTHAKVSKSNLFPISWESNVAVGKTTANVLRGWYQEDGTFRRGPFVRYIFHDPANKRYIAVDGFVYAPEMPRLQFYRGLDIIANSFQLEK